MAESKQVEFPANVAAGREAARTLRHYLAERGYDEATLFACELSITEACNNAVHHAAAACRSNYIERSTGCGLTGERCGRQCERVLASMIIHSSFGRLSARHFVRVLATLLAGSAVVSTLQAQTLLGGWLVGDPSDVNTDPVVVTFFSNNTYMLAHDGVAEGLDRPGMERGAFTWNGSAFSVTSNARDTTGNWGFWPAPVSATLTVSGNTASYSPNGEGPYAFTRVTSSSNLLIGSFVSTDGLTVATFLDSGYYFIASDGPEPGDVGMERGNYTFNSVTGALSGSVRSKTFTEGGLGTLGNEFSGFTILNLTADGFTIHDGVEGFNFTRVGVTAIPEPSTYALMIGVAGLGWAAWRRKSKC